MSQGDDLSGGNIVVMGLSSTTIFSGAGGDSACELLLLSLVSGEELRLPVTDGQAQEVLSFYLSALGESEGGAVPAREEEAYPPNPGPKEKRGDDNSADDRRLRAITTVRDL